ncbi:alpha/beta family hydrolase [Hyphomicrobium sp.]|uniref:alpha/beta family hydrolase n=1 Tax=Hyphomicrobium sp. TaxID=82 RepID=UPI002E35145E|nr:alpha/beta family hydrolase [Hyphomicrobium sp.]HEX2841669.1 alpha/beta family hydrolase [Hyphomicrobium sp.]
MTAFLTNGPEDATTWLLLAPGAGAPMTSGWMGRMSELLAEAGLHVVRFDFAYMTARQTSGSRRPPPKAERLISEYEAAVADITAKRKGGQLLIGGKSLGGRVASLAAQGLYDAGHIAGLVCLGYPFHPPDKPDQLRTQHLLALSCPTLIVQGTRDPFSGRDEVPGFGLPSAISVYWATDGDHDLAPRRASGATLDSNLTAAANEIAGFAKRLAQAR